MKNILILMFVAILGIFAFQHTQASLVNENKEELEMDFTGETEITLINYTRHPVIVRIYYKGSLEVTINVPANKGKKIYDIGRRTCRYFTYSYQLDNGSYSAKKEFRYCERRFN